MKKIFLVFSFWLLAFSFVQAATISFTAANEAVVGKELTVELKIETGGENINALEGEIIWSDDKLDLVAVKDVFSIISLWIREPKLGEAGRLPLAGLIPSGYREPEGQILTLIFQPRSVGTAVITLDKPQVLLNDGQGTALATTIKPLDLVIQSSRILNPIQLYVLFSIIGIIIVILIWWIIRRRKFFSV